MGFKKVLMSSIIKNVQHLNYSIILLKLNFCFEPVQQALSLHHNHTDST